MAVVLIDGLDLYNGTGANTGLQAKWTLSAGTIGTASMVAGRFGGQAFQLATVTSAGTPFNAFRTFPGSYVSASVGFAFKVTALPAADLAHHFLDLFDAAGGFQVGLALKADGSIVALRATAGNTGTTLGTSSAAILANTWHFLELSVTISATVGVLNLKVDGVTVLALAAQNTKNTANSEVSRLRFGYSNGAAAAACTYFFDDVYVVDTLASLGERRIETLYPSADTAQKDFTPNTGVTNFSRVNEAQCDGDTSYVQGSVVGNTDRYDFGDLTGAPATIDAVQVSSFAEKTDATARSIALQVKSGATTSDGGNFALAASYAKLERLLTTDPNGGGAWAAAAVNALQAGPKVTV